jgi:4-amino-4-deoxychorismate lyase
LLINGEPTQLISASDRGLAYGDGLFETIALIDGKPMLWERHMARLGAGEARLGLPPMEREILLRETLSLASGARREVVKIILTRGVGGRGYRPPAQPAVSRIISRHDWPDYPQRWFNDGIRLRTCNTRLGCSPQLAGIKHLNRLEQVLARREWDDDEIAEGLMLDTQGRVIEGIQSNLFLVKDGALMTPVLSQCGVAGVVRELVVEESAKLGITCRVRSLSLDDLASADALFMTNSLLGICPVSEWDGVRCDPTQIPPALRERIQRLALGEES